MASRNINNGMKKNPDYAHVIVNPAAGAGKSGKKWPGIKDLFTTSGYRFEHSITEGPGHAVNLTREAVSRGFRTVVSVGGDGTVNEIINGLHDTGCLEDTALGVVSTGTGSDYIRTIGVPRDHREACLRLLEPATKKVDLGMMTYGTDGQRTERLFANFAGMGFDAEMVRRTTQQFKHLGALTSYLMGALTTLVTYRNPDVIIRIDGGETTQRVCTVVMNNGRYGGGGMFTAPTADIMDGLLDVLIVGDLSKPDFIKSLPSIYKGTHLNHRKVKLIKAREVEVRSVNGRIPLQADGELLGEVPATFRLMPAALNIIA